MVYSSSQSILVDTAPPMKGNSMKWSRLKRNEKQFLLVCIFPIVLVLIISVIVGFTVSWSAATFVQFVLLTGWMVGAFVYVIADSKGRWPEASAFQRFANIITFKR